MKKEIERDIFISILTTTYNRAYRLTELYNSLQRQKVNNFEWIVIDDGSTDGTSDLIKEWKKTNFKFEIIYKYIPNGGKHRALNIGISMANGNLLLNVDSDDFLVDDALVFINNNIDEVMDNDEFSGIGGLMCYRNGEIVGGKTSFAEYVDADVFQCNFQIHPGDKPEIYKTNILKKYPYPEFENEKFLSEGAAIYRMAIDGYKMRWFNKTLVCCEYLSDGLTRNIYNLLIESPRGWAEYQRVLNQLGYTRSIISKKKDWIMMRDRLDKIELCEVLCLSDKDYNEYIKDYFIMKKKLLDILDNKTIALYGYGKNAHVFLEVLHELKIGIEYVIDNEAEKIDFSPTFRLNDNLPNVDVVIITLGGNMTTIRDIVGKLEFAKPKSIIYKLSDLCTGFF